MEETFASRDPSNELISEDLPTLERPKKAISGDLPRLQQAGIKPTADLVYTSGSSLDPHITPEAARAQIQRVAGVRKLDPNRLEILINQNTDDRSFGIFGEPGVNVLKLNLALDALR